MRGKSLLWLCLLSVLIVSVTVVVVDASPTTKVKVHPPAVAGKYPGTTFSINVIIHNVDNLHGWELKLRCDPFVLRPIYVTEGPFLKTVGPTYFKVYFSVLGDYVLVGCLLLQPCNGANGSGVLATVDFEAVGAGKTHIDLCDSKLFDCELNQIDHTEHDGRVTVHSVAEVTDAWPEHERYSISEDEDEFNTLYANISNLGEIGTVYAYAVFVGYTMEGTMIKLVSESVEIPQNETVTVLADFNAVENGEGKYYFSVHCEFAYTHGGTAYRGRKTKTMSFVVVP